METHARDGGVESVISGLAMRPNAVPIEVDVASKTSPFVRLTERVRIVERMETNLVALSDWLSRTTLQQS